MNATIAHLAMLGTLATLLGLSPGSLAVAPADPAVTFDYSPLFDGPCYVALKKPLDAALVAEARDHLPAWRAEWQREAPDVFATTVRLTGQPFKFHEAKAALITCPAFVSMSNPLMVNVGFLLGRARGGVGTAHEFSQVLIHEVLHRSVADRLRELPGGTTPLLEKYKAEPPVVRNHLHNVAIMEEVYRALGRDDQAAEMRKRDMSRGAVPGLRGATDMARALEIIATEHAATLVRELSAR